MLWFHVIAFLTALFTLFCMTRLGMRVTIGDIVTADVTLGLLRFQVAPSRKPKEEKQPKPKKKEPKTPEELLKKIPRPTMDDLKSAYNMLWPPAKNSLKMLGRGLRIDPLTLTCTIPGRNDPAQAAHTYGIACAAVWTVLPMFEQMIDIPKPSVHLGVDYEAANVAVKGQFGISMRLGTLIGIGLGMMIPSIRWILKFQKAHRKPKKEAQLNDPAVAA